MSRHRFPPHVARFQGVFRLVVHVTSTKQRGKTNTRAFGAHVVCWLSLRMNRCLRSLNLARNAIIQGYNGATLRMGRRTSSILTHTSRFRFVWDVNNDYK